MEEKEEQLQYVEQPEYDVEQEVLISKAKSSMKWGILGMVMIAVIYLFMILATVMATGYSSSHYYGYHRSSSLGFLESLFIIVVLVSIFFLIMSVIKLIAGVRGVRGQSRVKAILGIVFNAQNIICYMFYVYLFGFLFAAIS